MKKALTKRSRKSENSLQMEDEQFAMECLSEGEDMCDAIPFMDVRIDVLYEIAGSYAYRGLIDKSIESYSRIIGLISQLKKSESLEEFMDRFTENIGESFQFSPHPAFIELWKNFGKELKMRKTDLEESVNFLLDCIFSHKRSWLWKVSFGD